MYRALAILMAVIQFSFAYYFLEVFPRSREERTLGKPVRDIAKALNPDAELKRRTDRALAAYTALHERFVGFEAKYRYARLLKRIGREAEAKEMFNVVAANARRSALESQQDWVKLSQRELAQNTADA